MPASLFSHQFFRRLTVLGNQPGHVQARHLPIDHPPFAADHHPIGAIGAAQQQGAERVVAAGKTQFIQLEQRQVGLLAHRQLADVGSP